jgi:MYXO-CTERM domain-containing protein
MSRIRRMDTCLSGRLRVRGGTVLRPALTALALGGTLGASGVADATPIVFAGKSSQVPVNHSVHMVLMKNGDTTAITLMPDYEGPIASFAMVTVVPPDVSIDRLTTLRREFVDRVDTVSAPRFAEFWEMDPCEKGKAEQEWERDLTASDSGAFLGVMKTDPSKKVAKELLVDVDARQKEGEYTLELLDSWDKLSQRLADKSYKAPDGLKDALAPYLASGHKILLADVDSNRIELVGGDRAQLSPVRFWTERPYDVVPARLGLVSAAPKQELFLYVLASESRYQVTNYPTKFAPTNLRVDFKAKERMGEFYAGLHDLFLQKNPQTFLAEYVWHTGGCGQPCAGDSLLPHELLSLGGDVFDSKLSDKELNPDPGAPSEEEKTAFEASLEGKSAKEKLEAKKAWKADRQILASRRALLERHQYVLTRLHYRYGKDDLPKDPQLSAATGGIEGGIALPEGKDGEASTDVKSATQNRFQSRFNSLHPNIKEVSCDAPEPHRWGKAPPTYRGLRKIWIAEDLTRKNRTQINPMEMVMTAVPELGLGAQAAVQPAAVVETSEPSEEKKSSACGCRTVGAGSSGWGALGAAGAGLLAWFRRRRSARW